MFFGHDAAFVSSADLLTLFWCEDAPLGCSGIRVNVVANVASNCTVKEDLFKPKQIRFGSIAKYYIAKVVCAKLVIVTL